MQNINATVDDLIYFLGVIKSTLMLLILCLIVRVMEKLKIKKEKSKK